MKSSRCNGNYVLFVVLVVFSLIFSSVPVFAECPSADLDGDCIVDFADFAIMVSQWLVDEKVIAPDVVGMTLTQAQVVIEDTDLVIGTVLEEYSEIVLAGNIISQNPLAGQEVSSGEAIDLVISLGPEPTEPDIMWVSINDAGIVGELDGFTGEMSKYETTNAQYCWFLNDALATGDITVGTDNYVYGANGSNEGADFVGKVYYYFAGPGGIYNGATNGGASRINYTGSEFTVDSGFENHPVTYVSWYGSTAFGDYYGWRLPTEWEWQAVADYDGSFTFGCGPAIDNSIANYYDSNHPCGTTQVGAYGTYGYGMADMAGNVWEWTSSIYTGESPVNRGGSWGNAEQHCQVTFRGYSSPLSVGIYTGFRVCRDIIAVPDVVGLTLPQAEAAIANAGLVVGTIIEQYNDTVPVDDVISQNPLAGQDVSAGAAIDLVISLGPIPTEPNITWISINDPGIGGDFEGFIGQMSKYETTNAQYCWFLNDALASGDITVGADNYIYGANGSNEGDDFVQQRYYNLAGAGWSYNGAVNGGASRINYTGSEFTVDSGFEDHPVTYVSWYGAAAFASYYNWQLPTEWQWQAVADYDGSYDYGCGITFNNNMANSYNSTHPDGTTTCGSFGMYGYGICDLAGNVWEWTDSWYSDNQTHLVLRGGSWDNGGNYCTVSFRHYKTPTTVSCDMGFRVSR